MLDGEQADEARAHAAAATALRELRELAGRASELAPADAWALAGELEAVEFLAGEPAGAGTVAVLDPLALRARRVRALFLCGLQEGVFPNQRQRRGLLSEEDRRELERTSGLRLGRREDQLAAERYLLYAAVSRPEELLVLSWHVADDDGLSSARSLFVEDVCDLFEEDLLEHPFRGAAAVAPQALSAGAAGAEPEQGLRDERVLADLARRPWSASSLENYIACPVRWYVERVLRPGEWDPDAEPLRRGGLAHAALKDTLEGLRERTGSATVTPAKLALARELLAQALAERESEHPLSVSQERLPGARLRLRADLERYLEHAAGAESPLEPGPLELAFGMAPGEEECRARAAGVRPRRGRGAARTDRPRRRLARGGRGGGRLQESRHGPALAMDRRGQGAGSALHARRRSPARAQRRGRLLPAAVGQRPARPRDPRGGGRHRAGLRARRSAPPRGAARAAGRSALDGARRGRAGTARRARGQARELLAGGRLQLPLDLPLPRMSALDTGRAPRRPRARQRATRAAGSSGGRPQEPEEVHAVRLTPEQHEAVQRRSGPLSLSAAAGSGKTAVLVERFVAAVLRGRSQPFADPRDHVHRPRGGRARERVRKRFLDLGERAAARDTEAAYVSTIHGFCARLLAAHPLAAGLDPGFGVLDEGVAGRLRQRAFQTALSEFVGGEQPERGGARGHLRARAPARDGRGRPRAASQRRSAPATVAGTATGTGTGTGRGGGGGPAGGGCLRAARPAA